MCKTHRSPRPKVTAFFTAGDGVSTASASSLAATTSMLNDLRGCPASPGIVLLRRTASFIDTEPRRNASRALAFGVPFGVPSLLPLGVDD